jgi:hypothetical protein
VPSGNSAGKTGGYFRCYRLTEDISVIYLRHVQTEISMLATSPTDAIELPQVGSFGYLRGTGQRAQVLQRNHRPGVDGNRTCLVKLWELHRGRWLTVEDAQGNRTVEEADLFATHDEALHCGRKPRRRTARQSRRA